LVDSPKIIELDNVLRLRVHQTSDLIFLKLFHLLDSDKLLGSFHLTQVYFRKGALPENFVVNEIVLELIYDI
jgi:hypothetical protein